MLKMWKVYGAEGHRQRASFGESYSFVDYEGRINTLLCADKLGTNDYVVLIIEAPTERECCGAFLGQLSDGIFENCNYGKIVEF